MTTSCTLGEMMIAALARTIADGTLVFHGFGSPLIQLAMHVAKRTHAPRMILVAGATYGVDPEPPFLAPTSNDWVMDRGARPRSTSRSCSTLRRPGAWDGCSYPACRSTDGALPRGQRPSL